MKQGLLLLLIFFSFQLCGQRLGPYFIGSQGSYLENDEIKLYSAVGEPVNSFADAGDISLSQGVLQSLQAVSSTSLASCAAKSGIIFFEDCDDGTPFFFFQGDDGVIYDPYYGDGVEFEEVDSLRVIFGFEYAEFNSPCTIADRAIVLTCVEPEVVSSNVEVLPHGTITISPNPSIGKYDIQFATDLSDVRLSIRNTNGQQLYSTYQQTADSEKRFSLSLHEFPDGLYYLTILSNEGMITEKLILMR